MIKTYISTSENIDYDDGRRTTDDDGNVHLHYFIKCGMG